MHSDRWKRRVGACAGALLLTGAAGCVDGGPTRPGTPTTATASDAASPSAAVLPAVPTCDDVAVDVGAILRNPTKASEVPPEEDPTITVRASCLFDASLNSVGSPKVMVEIEYGRFAGEPGGRSADEIASIPAGERIKATCASTPQSLPGNYALAQVCSNTNGPVRSGAGFVKDGCYATAEVTVRDGQTPGAGARTTADDDVRQLATRLLDRLI